MNEKQEKKIDRVLRSIEREIYSGRFLPIVGPEKGRFYYLATRAVRAKHVLELGTLVGYSALLFYKAMDGKGKVTTVEHLRANFNEAVGNFRKAGVKGMEVVHGEASEALRIARARGRKFDVVFLDVEKGEYAALLDDCLAVLNKGGILLTDNASWDTVELKAFRKKLRESKLADSVIVPIGDGIAMSVKR